MSVPKVAYTQDMQPKTTSNEDDRHERVMYLSEVGMIDRWE